MERVQGVTGWRWRGWRGWSGEGTTFVVLEAVNDRQAEAVFDFQIPGPPRSNPESSCPSVPQDLATT